MPSSWLSRCSAVLQTHTWTVQAGADGISYQRLTFLILKQQIHGFMEHTRTACGQGGGMVANMAISPSQRLSPR